MSFETVMKTQESVLLDRVREDLKSLKGEAPTYRTSKYELRHANRFGEVIAAWIEGKTLKNVMEATGLSRYTIIKYYLSDPNFCKLLRDANETIFLNAVQERTEDQRDFINKASRLAEEALDELEALLHESDNESIRLKVAENLLDRDPEQRATRTKKVETNQPLVKIDFKFLQIAAQAAKETEDGL